MFGQASIQWEEEVKKIATQVAEEKDEGDTSTGLGSRKALAFQPI